VKTLANPVANANVGNIIIVLPDFDSDCSCAAGEMYDTVIGNRPNEQGLIDDHNPAVYK
jgi:hypothetical protein